MKRKINNGKRQRKQRVTLPSSTIKQAAVRCVPKQPYVDVNGVEWDSLTICVADGLDASMDGRGFDCAHAGATRLADAAPKLLAACRLIANCATNGDSIEPDFWVINRVREAIAEAADAQNPETLTGLVCDRLGCCCRVLANHGGTGVCGGQRGDRVGKRGAGDDQHAWASGVGADAAEEGGDVAMRNLNQPPGEMKNTYTLIDATEARDFMPTDCDIITERGDVVVGVVQEHGDVDDGGGEASRRAVPSGGLMPCCMARAMTSRTARNGSYTAWPHDHSHRRRL